MMDWLIAHHISRANTAHVPCSLTQEGASERPFVRGIECRRSKNDSRKRHADQTFFRYLSTLPQRLISPLALSRDRRSLNLVVGGTQHQVSTHAVFVDMLFTHRPDSRPIHSQFSVITIGLSPPSFRSLTASLVSNDSVHTGLGPHFEAYL
jgi:hypothetical protein